MTDWRVVALVLLAIALVVPAWACARIAHRAGRSVYWGLAPLFPPAAIVFLWVVAFATWRDRPRPPARSISVVTAAPLLVVAALWFGVLRSWWIYQPGQPTPMAEGETPVEAICRIQQEFIALRKPVLRELVYHRQWTETVFAVGTFERSGFFRAELSRDARGFMANHSHLEIVAALAPLLGEPGVSAEAAVLIAALPMPSKATASARLRWLGDLIARSRYLGPDAPGSWSADSAAEAERALAPLFGKRFVARGTDALRPDAAAATLDQAISNALDVFVIQAGESTDVLVDDGRFSRPISNLDRWLAQPPPRITNAFQAELDAHPAGLLRLVAFPLQGNALGTSSYAARFVLMMGLHETHWPLMGAGLAPQHKPRFERALGEAASAQARAVCAMT